MAPNDRAQTTTSARARGLVVLALLVAACASTSPRRVQVILVETTSFAGTHYPVPQSLTSVPQPPPSLPQDGPELASAQPVAMPRSAPDWRNAAVRDVQTAQLAYEYLGVAQQVNAALRQSALDPGDRLDLLPVRKVHAELLGTMARLVEEASALEGAWLELAQDWSVDVLGPLDESRAGRLRLMFQLSSCVRRDVGARTRDGLAYLDARRQGLDDAGMAQSLLDADGRLSAATEDAILHTRELMTCARLAWRVSQHP